MADGLVKATLDRDYIHNGASYRKGDEIEVTPNEERWLRWTGHVAGGLEEGEPLGGPDREEADYDDHEDGDAGIGGIVPEDQQESGEEAEEDSEGSVF
jgi:hypothetical protein